MAICVGRARRWLRWPVLKNPAHAGAFVYGRTRFRPPRREGALPQKAQRAIEEWRIVVKDRYPPYIDWPIYKKLRAVIRDNRAEYMRIRTRGAPRNGELLLHGIARCARCGHKMYVRYKGGGEYVCNHLRTQEGQPTCQHIRANRKVTTQRNRWVHADSLLSPPQLARTLKVPRTGSMCRSEVSVC
ncbi:recombinase zinc beta ribbon domain-containing protein [Bradyrhizobium sp. 187]|uniref:recombinase zinc beta ribbon domain-containing protein n=1 Tax=Bradyrhizobium sp. 187 TaxID=2782655 RepID=UPI001FFE3E86|nr:recombinase zinc beta ribbon domain-containing protein [Bradyrhizobium sp. 187]